LPGIAVPDQVLKCRSASYIIWTLRIRLEEMNMPAPKRSSDELVEKIRSLPPDRLAEVEDFVDFLRQRSDDGAISLAAMRLSENAFQKVWDNPEDADYDRL
jgi:hypothetical protein